MNLTTTPAPWRALVWELQGRPDRLHDGSRLPDGEPGVRDVDAPCDVFEPVGAPYQYSKGTGECDTDGHYLCRECVHISLHEVRRRKGLCQVCGSQPFDSGPLKGMCPECAR